MLTVIIQPNFECWRTKARELLIQGVRPEDLIWLNNAGESGLFDEALACDTIANSTLHVPRPFMVLARTVAAHTDGRRWGLLYRLLWRLTINGERHLLSMPVDPDMRLVQTWQRAVNRDIHKMHAFVRFRQVDMDRHETCEREQYVAWFEPQYRILQLGSPFFQKRFSAMNWSILTPDECAHWDGKALTFTEGVSRDKAPEGDALDELWRTYYRSIFNPARLKVHAMQAEMPEKYWKNLPEASLITSLIADSGVRVDQMLKTEARPVKAAPRNAYLESLRAKNATQEQEEEA